jgi:hypothetical protein
VYPTWNRRPISVLIRPSAQYWLPANPCAGGPRFSSASSRARCCGLSRSRDTGPRDRSAAGPPSRQACRHLRTVRSRASMARRSGLSESTVGRIWRKFDLKPHLLDGFKLSTDPLFAGKVVDVVGLYHNPP